MVELVLARKIVEAIGRVHYIDDATGKMLCDLPICPGIDRPTPLIKNGKVGEATCGTCRARLSKASDSGIVKIARVRVKKLLIPSPPPISFPFVVTGNGEEHKFTGFVTAYDYVMKQLASKGNVCWNKSGERIPLNLNAFMPNDIISTCIDKKKITIAAFGVDGKMAAYFDICYEK